MAASTFPLLDITDCRSANAVVFSESRANCSAIKKSFDLHNVVFGEFVERVWGALRAKLFEGGVAIDAKPVRQVNTAEYRANSAFRQSEALSDCGGALAIHSGLKNIVNHSVRYDPIGSLALNRGSRSLDFFGGRVSIDAKEVSPRLSPNDVFNDSLCDAKSFCNHTGRQSANSSLHDLPSDFTRDSGVCAFVANSCAVTVNEVLRVFLGATPSQMVRIAARRIVAGVKRHISFTGRINAGQYERHSVGPVVSPVMPKHTVSVMPSGFPFPAIIRASNVNFFPKSFHGVLHYLRETISNLSRNKTQGDLNHG